MVAVSGAVVCGELVVVAAVVGLVADDEGEGCADGLALVDA